MKVEIITTGEEVLSGQITDTNAGWISQQCTQIGLPISRRNTVGDRREDLVALFRERAAAADILIVNGGLGPTTDDLSAAVAAEAKGEPLMLFPEWVAAMEARFARAGRELHKENLKQAMLPESATIIDNPVGTACGFRMTLSGCLLYFTPGVPSELKPMLRNHILPHIKDHFQLRAVSKLQRLHCFGISESRLGGMLDPIPLPEGITLGFRAHLPTIEIKVMGHGRDEALLTEGMAAVAARIREITGPNILCEEDHTLASFIQEHMIAAGHTLALAESCTGGMVAAQVVDIPGSSAYFDRGFVTYTNRAKQEMLGVDPAQIERHGAVSLEVAAAMARGAQQRAGTSHALAISGVAGPGGGTEEKPVGLVTYALATPTEVIAQALRGPDWGRTAVRKIAAAVALDMLRRHLLGLEVCPGYDYARPLAVEKTTGS